MTDHADTIRRPWEEVEIALREVLDPDDAVDAALLLKESGLLCPVAERQQAQHRAEIAEIALEDLRAERQQAIDERDEVRSEATKLILLMEGFIYGDKQVSESGLVAAIHRFMTHEEIELPTNERALHAEARCEQAIDALREIADHVPGRYVVQPPDYVQLRARARAALLSIGEQP